MASSFAGSFAPYTPPPDEPSRLPQQSVSHANVWFGQTSYQSGGLPTSDVTLVSTAASSNINTEGVQHNGWETTYGLRVDVLAAFAYLLGPVSAFILLVWETHNDYVRFHAYQSALLMTPLLVMHILATVMQLPSWTCFLLALILWVSGIVMAIQAFLGASGGGLVRYHLPKLGDLADRWVEEE